MPKVFIRAFILMLILNLKSYSQGQVLDPSFRIPDNVMPTGFKTKEMSDTFKLKVSTPVVTPFDPNSVQQSQNRFNSSRNEGVQYKSKIEREISEQDLPAIIIKNLNSDYSSYKKLQFLKIENSQEFGYDIVYGVTLELNDVKKSLTFSETGNKLSEK